ncbi:hypothetical protein NP493_1062g00080 [Ridgeia piscesae]|uniref:Uncharacterized protein n=1 Tax=Ridgeia piscesae TaxID=27915 RepID=A0AAD9KIN5_RIDPI|nr:hypothetical protein NP493_1062g00080 [Ridgeia piscesae]
MSDQPTSVSNDQLAGVSSQTDHLAEVSGELEALQFDEEDTGDIEITGDSAGSSVVIKQEQDDPVMEEVSPFEDLDDSDDEVICLDRQTTIKYMSGEMSFDEYSALLEEQVKQEPDDPDDVTGVTQLQPTPSGSQRKSSQHQ